jgi:hypothetical protein
MPDNEESNKKIDPYRVAPDMVKYYANNVRLETTAFDLTMSFGQVAEPLPNKSGDSYVDLKAEIKLSWLQAKVTAIFLSINVAAHEAQLGAIQIPSFVFGPDLKHLANQNLTLEEMYSSILKVFEEKKHTIEKL